MRSHWRDGDRVRSVDLVPQPGGRFRTTVDGVELDLAIERLEDGRMRLSSSGEEVLAEVTTAGARRFVRIGHMDFVLEREAGGRRRAAATGGGALESPMPGMVTKVWVAEGDVVTRGQPLLAIEAMKMEHVIRSPRDGRVKRLAAAAGEMVEGGVTLVELEEAS
ncbi:MAG TPA: biotin/lipoyl-containing protein [Candidatus Eisenbacteria bacterium]|jgi:biotin carboxyl carrier protein